MPGTVDTEELRRLLEDDGVQLVEVLPSSEYELEHLPGAISLPLTELTPERARDLDPSRPVVAYCFDYQ